MVIKLNGKMENYKEKLNAYMTVRDDENSTQNQIDNAFTDAMNALAEDLTVEIKNQAVSEAANKSLDSQILLSRGNDVLTSEEKKFFNAVVQDGGFKDETILPETTQERVFQDLTKAHPLLDAIGIQDLGAATKFIYSDPTKAYAWKELFGEITGQVNTAFREEKITQLKLTAFAAIPNDMLELGPEWVERYVRELLVESYSVGLEYGYVNGRGSAHSEPVGLMKNVDANTGAVTDKTSSGTLTFAPSQYGETVTGELYNVVKALSTNEKGESRKVMNKIVMVVNPVDAIGVQFRNTIQTANGQWVTSLPYNIQTVESEEVPVGKALFFIKGEYIAAVAGGYKLKKFDQTLAIEDATLYTIKRFANGRPRDNKTALVYDLDIKFTASAPETP
ncbi:phage major capsid protein [Lysinibacillus mangiferihumi]|uniref:Phage major capsid protein n=1 Tax=Lysinibacillus mangiferihumi TaxID=1130819 RepID=A0A4U2ZFD1_9BACI|nr:phage major capsid protein [Lysinibacillus mangiferihumi]TKI72011.1 phage major capsid protein [Lysinibacillus mangiferihumi]